MKNYYNLFVYLFICLARLNAQECGFVDTENYQTYDQYHFNRSSANVDIHCINVCFRIVRDNNGANAAINPNIIPQVLSEMNSKFNSHGIYFNQVGTFDYINSTNYNNYLQGSSPANIPNCLNIYFIKNFNHNPSLGGIATFGTLRVTIKGIHATNDCTVSHEVGHALNLRHTFRCTSTANGFNASCAENPFNSVECHIRGDLVCDTPADYTTMGGNSNVNNPYGLNNYNPDKKNIMSYWIGKQHFSPGQGERMFSSITGAPELQSIRSYNCANVVGPSKICRSGRIDSYRVSVAPIGTPTYNWSVSGCLQIIGSSTNSSVNITRTLPSTSNSTISVTINGSIVKTKTIRTRCLFGVFRMAGLYDWVSKDYGDMGLIIPIDPEDEDLDDPVVKYMWEIHEQESEPTALNSENIKPYFVGALPNEKNIFTSSTNQAIVNWGNISKSYLITCHEITQSGEKYLISENYVDVGDPKNNPCFKNNIQSIIAPNPVRNGLINVIVQKPENTSPCNYKDLEQPQFFNSELDKVNNSITIFDYQGNEIYRNVFETNEFTIENVNLISGNNYVVNLFTNEGGFNQQVIIAE